MQSCVFVHLCMLVPSLSKELLHASVILPLSSAVCLCLCNETKEEHSHIEVCIIGQVLKQSLCILIYFHVVWTSCMFFVTNVASSVLCKCGGNPECQQLDHSVHRWPDVLLEPGYALPTTGKYWFRPMFYSFHQLKPLCSWIWIDERICELSQSSLSLWEQTFKL